MTFTDAKQRFSNRVADYVRYRPGYTTAVRDLLRAECGLRSGHIVADIPIELPRPRSKEHRYSPEFAEYVTEIESHIGVTAGIS